MAWKIDRDYINEPGDSIPSRVGRAQGTLSGETFTFRLLDDDGEIYYHGVADAASTANDDMQDGGLYMALKWGEADAGCTDLQVHASDALKHGLTTTAYLDARGKGGTDWVSIYG